MKALKNDSRVTGHSPYHRSKHTLLTYQESPKKKKVKVKETTNAQINSNGR